jgi:PIN domain nuclease of toxin-antitoxin system
VGGLPVKFLLDTHVWFWLLENPEAIPTSVRRCLTDSKNIPFGLCSISLWEVAKLVQKGRIKLTIPLADWFAQALTPGLIRLYPLTESISINSTTLPDGFSSDPADEMIVATARLYNLTLITADKRILSYPHVKTLWK